MVNDEDCKKLSNEAAAALYTSVAKALYVTKRARSDIICILDDTSQVSQH